MGLVACPELGVCDSQLVVQYQSSCSWCELVWVVFTLVEQIIRGMEVLMGDLESYLAVAKKILEIAEQQSEMGVGGTVVNHVQVLLDIFLPPNLPEEQMTADGQGVYELRRTSTGNSLLRELQTGWKRGVGLQNSKVGAKRGLREGGMFQHYVDGCCAISIRHGTSKKVKIVGSHLDSPTNEASTIICYKDDCRYISNDMIEEFPSLDSLDSTPLGDQSCKSVASRILSSIVGVLRNIPGIRSWFSNGNTKFAEVQERVETPTRWWSLPNDLQENILLRLEFKDLFRFKSLSKSCKEYIESDAFRQRRGAASSQSEGLFTAINYHIKENEWRCSGFDLLSRMWKPLPSLSPALPAPDPELFKEYSVCGHGGFICADVAKLPEKGQLVVLNPLTQKKRYLPSLLYPRSPVLVHLWVDSANSSFKVIVAGSSASSDEKLSRKMEVFDSETSAWEEVPELPGPAFGLNEHQVGVCVDGVLHFISFLHSGGCRGVVALDIKTKTWLSNKACPIPFSTYSNTLQLVESKGKVYLFSEQVRGGSVDHCIDVLEDKCKLRTVVRAKKSGGRGLQVYPEHTCVSFGDEKLCIFNTLTRGGVVYDMRDGKEVEVLKPPPFDKKGDNFFSLNPASFMLQPNFDSDPNNNPLSVAC